MARRRAVIRDVFEGAIAGAVATWVMGKVTTYLYEREGKTAREREDDARRGKTAYGVAAEKVARAAGVELSEKQRERYGSVIQWAMGVGAGALYGVLGRALRGRRSRAASPSVRPSGC